MLVVLQSFSLLIFTWSLSSQIISSSTFFIVVLACDYVTLLFKEPTVKKTSVPEEPKPTVALVEKKIISPPKGKAKLASILLVLAFSM